MRKALLPVLLLLSSSLRAQMDVETFLTFNVNTTGGIKIFKEASNWAQNYNNTFGDQLRRKMGNSRLVYGYNMGVTWLQGALCLEYQFNNMTSRATAVFKEDIYGSRVLLNRFRSHNLVLGWVVAARKALITTGTILGTTNVYTNSYKKYASGDISVGDENAYNFHEYERGFNWGLKLNADVPVKEKIFLHFGMQMETIFPGTGPFTPTISLNLGLKYALINKN